MPLKGTKTTKDSCLVLSASNHGSARQGVGGTQKWVLFTGRRFFSAEVVKPPFRRGGDGWSLEGFTVYVFFFGGGVIKVIQSLSKIHGAALFCLVANHGMWAVV